MRDRLAELKKKSRAAQQTTASAETHSTEELTVENTSTENGNGETSKSEKKSSLFSSSRKRSSSSSPQRAEVTAATVDLPAPPSADGADVDLEAGATPLDTTSPEEEAAASKKFFNTVREIRQDLGDFRSTVEDIERLHIKILATISGEQSKKYSEELEENTLKATALAGRLRERLKLMEEENQSMVIVNGNAEFRIRQNQHASLLARFVKQMREYQAMQQKYKEKYKMRMTKQLQIIKPDASEREVEDAISSDTGNIFGQEMLTAGRPETKVALQDLKDRHQDLIQLERSILELHQMFVDMAVLIESQQELIDQIEANVGEAKEYMGGAAKTMKRAVVLKRRARKWRIIIIVVVILIIAAIAIPVATSIAGKKN